MSLFRQASLVLIFLIVTTTNSRAQSDYGDALLYSQGCRMVGSLAETVMGERQKEVPISEMMHRIKATVSLIGFDGLPIDENGLAKVVLLVYEMPRFHSSELQQDAVSAFRNIVERQCYNQQLHGD